jgi:hypothetical protein
MPTTTNRQRQIALAQFVLQNDGFINVLTPFQSEKRLGQGDDIYFVADLPRGDFTVWRVSFDDRDFTDEDLASAMRLCEAAGPVSNLNLHGSGITASGIAQITRIADSLTSLKLSETDAFTEESIPFLSACKNLRSLFITGTGPDASHADTEKQVKLIRKLEEALPECRVHLE